MASKPDTVMAFEKGSSPTLVTWDNSQATNKKHYISISSRLVATKLDKVMAYNIGPPRTESDDSLIT